MSAVLHRRKSPLMESPLSFFRMHWDHEPRQLVGRGVLTAPRLGGLGTARPTLRFMEIPLSFSACIGTMNLRIARLGVRQSCSPVALSVGSPPLPKRQKTGALQNLAEV